MNKSHGHITWVWFVFLFKIFKIKDQFVTNLPNLPD